MNTKARHKQILSVAANLIALAGGVEAIDALPQDQHKAAFNRLVDNLIDQAGCSSRQIARNNVAKAMRKGRDYLVEMSEQGGPRQNSGRPTLPEDQQRQPASTRLAPGSKELAQAIAEVLELGGWGRAVDMALVRMVENDRGLKIKLAKMGIIVKEQKQ